MADRRSFLRGLVLLPLIGGSIAILGQPTAAAVPADFDPAAFLSDLRAAGYDVTACRGVPRGGGAAPSPSYFITPTGGSGFGEVYLAVMVKWTAAMNACPDHVERVVAHVFEDNQVAAERRRL
ncbi:hypothetical protein [Lichenibacterium ramalinae]|uniref:Uncharacterized protein n=1 Tax=Lichenibacterium ramalinae TaxID=2316527 RepID=A0A4Q2REA9_9HYPH|nr:hypothetical protein [Lichenibacterium ramalinae]RYB06249.1 hypothetical protein D3272_05645 [Lichenibacterium ramalinae]